MGRLSGKIAALTGAGLLLFSGCVVPVRDGVAGGSLPVPFESPGELYDKALTENVLVVYTVSTRVVETKESFEKAYPGLFVEVHDLRSPNLIEEVERGHRDGAQTCDVVICNDNSGEFKARLVDAGIVIPYLPEDIAAHMKEAGTDGTVSFLNEAELLFYSTARYDACPIDNIWALTDERYRGRIYMPGPLRSFSTYALCGASMDREQEFEQAYRAYYGEETPLPGGGNDAAEAFWRSVSQNTVFTNSSDEVIEALNDGKADFGWCVSSKLRLTQVGYRLAPVYRLDPFAGCRTSYAVMMTADCANENAAKLFIRYLLGEADGQGEGYRPFRTQGTWSVRDDVPDGNDVPFDQIDLITPDQGRLIAQREHIVSFWTDILRSNE